MDQDQFWQLVESSKKAADGTFDGHCESLLSQLSGLSPDEVISFQRLFDELHARAYSWDLWGAAYVIGGGCSDDSFADFRSWLISMGQEIYEKALSDPESLSAITVGRGGVEDTFFEEFAYIPSKAYEAKLGEHIPRTGVQIPSEPTGDAWEEDEDVLAARYPRLFAKYGED